MCARPITDINMLFSYASAQIRIPYMSFRINLGGNETVRPSPELFSPRLGRYVSGDLACALMPPLTLMYRSAPLSRRVDWRARRHDA